MWLGNDAQRAFEELIAIDISVERKNHLRTAMLKYCEKDTFVMVGLVRWLFSAANY